MSNITRHKCTGGLLVILVALLISGFAHAASSSSTNYTITRDVMSSGGGIDSSTNYKVRAAAGQSSAIGASTSSNYNVVGGFHAMRDANAPQITGVWPGDGPIGDTISVFIFGNGFDLTPGATEVYFNGVVQSAVESVSSEMLIVRVLGDAGLSGPVTVVTPAGSVTSSEALNFVP